MGGSPSSTVQPLCEYCVTGLYHNFCKLKPYKVTKSHTLWIVDTPLRSDTGFILLMVSVIYMGDVVLV